MNVVRLVASRVRVKRQTSIFRTGSATAQPLIADPETEPHKYEMQILAMYNLSSSSTSSTDDKILAIAKMGHLCWTGGLAVAEFAGKAYLPTLVAILERDSELYSMKLQVIKTISEFCYGCKKNQSLSRNLSVIDIVIENMCENEGDVNMRRWCLHTLFVLLVGNETNQKEALGNPHLTRCVELGTKDNWDGWEHNEANELVLMMNLNLN